MNLSLTKKPDYGHAGPSADQGKKLKKAILEEYDSANHFFSIDDAIIYVGDNSSYQQRIVTILSLNWALFSFLIMGWTFLFLPPVFKCKSIRPDGTEHWDDCDEAMACSKNSNDYLIDYVASPQSLALDFQLYCERHYLIGACGSFFFLGSFIAGIIFPQLSDKEGRRRAILLSIMLGGGAAVLSVFSVNFLMFTVLIMISGVGFNGFETISLVYVAEISGEKTRNYSSVVFASVWACAQFVFSPLVYLQSNWRVICAGFIGGPMLATLFLTIPNLLETPRYLYSKRKFLEARSALNYIAGTNHRPLLQSRLLGEMDEENKGVTLVFNRKRTEEKLVDESHNYGYIDLLCKYKSLSGTTRSLLLVWFFRYFAYYGLNFSLSSLGADIYLNFSLVAIGEMLACAVAANVKLRFNRISSLAGSAILVTISCIFIAFFNIPSWCYAADQSCYQKSFSLVFALIVKFGISLFANILITYTSELYPTVVRSLGLGLNMTVGKFGNISMPLIVSALQVEEINPLVSFAFMGLMSAFLILNMKETKGVRLTDQISEIENNKAPLLNLEMRRTIEPYDNYNNH